MIYAVSDWDRGEATILARIVNPFFIVFYPRKEWYLRSNLDK
jgi:hypothetical protein